MDTTQDASIARAHRVALLWQHPTIPDSDIPEALRIPPSLWNALKAEGDTPPLFTIGRRLFARTADLRTWLDAKASTGQPGSRRLRTAARRAA